MSKTELEARLLNLEGNSIIPTNKFDKDLNKTMLTDIHLFLKENNIPHMLMFGTLLGAYRNNDFLSADIDIAVSSNYYWKLRNIIDKSEDVDLNCVWRREIAVWKHNRKLDILFYDIIGDNTYFYIYKKNTNTKRWHTEQRYVYKTKDIFPLKKFKFIDYEFNIPKSPENLFKDYYGGNWKIPNPTWDRDKFPPPNLQLDYRQIACKIWHAKKNGELGQYLTNTYDPDWIKIYDATTENQDINEPYIINFFDNKIINNYIDFNILLEVLNAKEEYKYVSSNVLSNKQLNFESKTSPISRSNTQGYKFWLIDSDDVKLDEVVMVKNNHKPSNRELLYVNTK